MSQPHRVYSMMFASVYPMYVQKAERKQRSRDEVEQLIRWLTGYDQPGLQAQITQGSTLEQFFSQAPAMNPARTLITGVVCGVRVEEVVEPLMREIRYLDKLVDELAKGKPVEKILRRSA